ncbi:MBL fold metallo-hydrolase [Nocardioides sp. KIGAM211]|uniref:MBL fold metallo-hydrolase n=2 Tax=Nocardioides luti TaxID=2761101 RepID=A0A7X0RDY7_9ACTN|nr:MBL fold metallo-hydrolase [Nocardioides luti]
MQVITLEVPELGNRSHLVHDGTVALVVDPPRDPAAVEAAAEQAGVEIAAVADTHVHNDYVSGALGLARRHGADYLLAADERVDFERVGVRGGEQVRVGALDVLVVDTPGHTRHHQSFVASQDGGRAAAFSGGSLLLGTVGRTDLVDEHLTEALARAQWASARTLGALPDDTHLHPTHGFGSFCAGSTSAAGTCSGAATIGDEREANPALVLERDAFVRELLAGFGPIPSYYQHMAPLNRAGAGRGAARPAHPLSADELDAAVRRGAWVVDLRARRDFAHAHLPGTVSVEYGTQFATYVGWLVPWQHELVLLTDAAPDLGPALRDLAAIGIEGAGAHVLTSPAELAGTYRRTDWAGFLEAATAPRVVVDVRQRDEFEDGHLPDAIHLPVQDVEVAADSLPAGELWVHCRSGYRAGIAASLLHRTGRSVVHVDDAWERVGELAIPTTTAA